MRSRGWMPRCTSTGPRGPKVRTHFLLPILHTLIHFSSTPFSSSIYLCAPMHPAMVLSAILTVPAMAISVCMATDYKGASGGTCVGLWDAFSPQACDVHCKISTYVPSHPTIHRLGPFNPTVIHFLKERLVRVRVRVMCRVSRSHPDSMHICRLCAVASRTSSSSCSAPG